MSGGYVSPPQGEYGALIDELRRLAQRLAELETPTGTSVNSLVDQVQLAIADIDTTVVASITANSYTKTQIDGLVANPPAGSNVTGDVLASGQVSSNGSPLKSQPSYNYAVATSYKGAWIDGVTFQIGYSASSELVKSDLQEMQDPQILGLTPYWGRYVWDTPDSPLKVFLLASDVQQAGFGPDVAPVVEGEPLHMHGMDGEPILVDGEEVIIPVGQAYTINYGQLVVPLIAAYKQQQQQIADLTARLTAAGIA